MTNNEFYKLIREYNIRNYCRGTYSPRNSHLKTNLLPLFGLKEVRDTTSSDINLIYAEMESAGLAQNTLFGAQDAFRSYFKFAIEQGEADHNPVYEARQIYPQLQSDKSSVQLY